MKKRNSFAILTIAGAAVLAMASCTPAEPDKPDPKPEHQHTYSELHAQVNPTCLSEGQKAYYTCDGCDLLFNENKEVISQIETIPTLPHTPHHHDATDPSCTEAGTGEYWTCDNAGDDKLYGDKDCKEVIQSIPVVDPKGHKLSHMDGNPASCSEAGWKEYYKCDDCDALFEDAQGKTSIADLEAWKKGAGKLDLAPHSAQPVAGQASTCKEHGWKDYYHCGGCDGYFEDAAATKPIEDLEVWKAGAGKLELAAHTPVKQDGKEPTCTSDGWEDYYKCSVCDRLFEDEACESEITDLAAWKSNAGKLPMGEHGHTLVSGQAATCKKQGYKDAYYCEGCEQYFEDAEAKTLIGDADAYEDWKLDGGLLVVIPHNTSKVDGKSATCEANGWKDYYQCSECKDLFEDEAGKTPIADLEAWKLAGGKIAAKGHDAELTKTDAVEPTCYQTGVKEYYQCESCEQYFEDADAKTKIADLAAWKVDVNGGLIPATGDHDFDYSKTEVSWDDDMATAVAPCSTDGCTETISEEKQGTYVKDSEADCENPEKGHYEVTFVDTNFGSAETEEGSVSKGEPLGHDYGDLIPEVDAQRGATGMKAHYVCGECGDFFDEDKNKSTVEELTIASRHHAFVVGEQEGVFELSHIYMPGEEVIFDAKFDDNNEFSICAYAENWKARTDFIKVFADGSNNQSSFVKSEIIDDGYVRVRINVASISNWADVKEGCLTDQVQSLHISRYNETSGYIEIEPSVIAHEYGDLIPTVDACRETAGVKAHYHCPGCDQYFTEDKELTTLDKLAIPSRLTPLTSGKDATITLDKTYSLTDTLVLDFHFDNTDNAQVCFMLFDGSDWDNYLGYISVYKNSSGKVQDGVFAEQNCGFVRVTINLANVKKNGTGGNSVKKFYARGIWTTINGWVDVAPSAAAKDCVLGDLIPEGTPTRNAPALRAHYVCEDCGKLFDSSKKPTTQAALEFYPDDVVFYEPKEGDQTYIYKQINRVEMTEDIVFDIWFDNADAHQEVGINYYCTSWGDYFGKYWIDCDKDHYGAYFEGNYPGMTIQPLDDGWYRVTADLDKLTAKSGSPDHVEYIWLSAPGDTTNRGSGKVDFNPDVTINSLGYRHTNGKYSYISTNLDIMDTISLDVKYLNGSDKKLNIRFEENDSNYFGWFELTPTDASTGTWTVTDLGNGYIRYSIHLATVDWAAKVTGSAKHINQITIHNTWSTADALVKISSVKGKAFTSGVNFDIKPGTPLTSSDVFQLDVKFAEETADKHINVYLCNNSSTSQYYGNYSLNCTSKTGDFNGISVEKLSDGYVRFTFVISELTNGTETKPSSIAYIYFRGAWTNVSGYAAWVINPSA